VGAPVPPPPPRAYPSPQGPPAGSQKGGSVPSANHFPENTRKNAPEKFFQKKRLYMDYTHQPKKCPRKIFSRKLGIYIMYEYS